MLEQDVTVLTRTYANVQDKHAKRLIGRALRSVVNRFTGVKQRESVDFTTEEKESLRNGKKIECVKLVKARLGLSLLDAKNYVEARMGPYYIAPKWPT